MLQPGTMVENFEISRLIGRGGMGEVYLARDTLLGRKVALKLVSRERLGSQQAVDRLLQEAKITARFNHPHIVTLYATGQFDGSPYLALEYLEGRTLKQRMREETIGLRDALRIGLAIAEALQEAHHHQVLHRDLKPENVIIPRDGRLRVLDFGIAKPIVERPPAETTLTRRAVLPALAPSPVAATRPADADLPVLPALPEEDPAEFVETQDHISRDTWVDEVRRGAAAVNATGAELISGTPAYMAPEQWRGDAVAGATDMWALGAMLFELFTGHRPFTAPDSVALAVKVLDDKPAPAVTQFAEVPDQLADLIKGCLEKRADRRPTAAAAVDVLNQLLYQRRSMLADEQSPFRGLLPFDERHADFFFGRSAEIATFLERLREQPVLPVVGPSGAGKSSFVLAGIIPRLREQGSWAVLQMRPGSQPFATLASRLVTGESTARGNSLVEIDEAPTAPARPKSSTRVPVVPEAPPPRDPEALAAQLLESPRQLAVLLHNLARDERAKVLLFVDQLEELCTLVEDEGVRLRFMQALSTAADDPAGPVRVVFTLRDDFLGRLAIGPEAREVLGRVTVVRSPAPELLTEALVRPLEAVGYRFDDPALPGQMVASVQREAASLPLLQFAAQTLWDRRDKTAHLLRRITYDAMGGVVGALAEHADGVLSGFSPPQLRLARELLLRLVTPSGARRVLAKPRLLEGLGADAETVLTQLVRARLLAVRHAGHEEGSDVAIELVHESLVHAWTRLARWLDENKDELTFLSDVGQAAELWRKRGERSDEVWQGEVLRDALHALQRCTTEVPELVRRFLQAGRRKEQRRRAGKRVLLAAAFVGLAAIAGVLAWQNREARRQRAQAEQQRAIAQTAGAWRAYDQRDLLEARSTLRLALETRDSATARALWWRLQRDPLQWKRDFGRVVFAVEFSPDGSTLAVATAEQVVYLLDARTRDVLRALRGHDDVINALAFSADGRLLASGSADGDIFLWPLPDGEGSRLPRTHERAVYGLDFSPDGATLASAGADRGVHLTDVASGKQRALLGGHTDMIRGVRYSPDGTHLITAGYDHSIRIWDARAEKLERVLDGHTDMVAWAEYAPDSATIASASADGTVRQWDARDGHLLRMLHGHRGGVWAGAFSRDGSLLATGSIDNEVRLWDAKTGEPRAVLDGHSARIWSISFSPDGAQLVSSSSDKQVILWHVARAGGAADPVGHTDTVYHAGFSPDGRWVASSGYDRTARLWDVATGEQRRVLRGHTAVVTTSKFSPDSALLATASYDRSVRIWDVASGQEQKLLLGHGDTVWGLAFTPDQKQLVTASNDKTARIWDTTTWTQQRTLTGHTAGVASLAMSPDGTRIATGGYDNTIRIWDLASGRELRLLTGHAAVVWGLHFSADGKQLLSGAADGAVKLWDVATGNSRLVTTHRGRVYMAQFHPDGQRIASASSDGTARILDLRTNETIEITGHRAEVNSLFFNPDGALAVSASDDETVRLWDVATGHPRWRAPLLLAAEQQLFTHRGWLDLSTEQPQLIELPDRRAWSLAVAERGRLASAVGDQLCLASFDGTVEIWRLSDDALAGRASTPNVTAVQAVDGRCLALADGNAVAIDPAGTVQPIGVAHASALAVDGDGLWLADADSVQRFSRALTRQESYPVAAGVSALAANARWIALGTRGGGIELLDRRSGRRLARPTFEGTPASPVQRLAISDRGMVAAGFANGLVGLWSVDDGRRLLEARLHGPIVHLVLTSDRLLAASELGGSLRWDLGVFAQSACQLLREVWREVPVEWQEGQAVLRPPPVDNPCVKSK